MSYIIVNKQTCKVIAETRFKVAAQRCLSSLLSESKTGAINYEIRIAKCGTKVK